MKMGSRVRVKYFVERGVDYSGKKGQALSKERGNKWGVRIDGRSGRNLVIPANQLEEIPWEEGE